MNSCNKIFLIGGRLQFPVPFPDVSIQLLKSNRVVGFNEMVIALKNALYWDLTGEQFSLAKLTKSSELLKVHFWHNKL